MYHILIISSKFSEHGIIPIKYMEDQIRFLESFNIKVSLLLDPDQREIEKSILSGKYDACFTTTRESYRQTSNKVQPLSFNLFQILEHHCIDFIGSDYVTQLFINDKMLTSAKSGLGIPNVLLSRESHKEKLVSLSQLAKGLRFPLIIKPNSLSGSLGITRQSVVHNQDQLDRQISFLFDRFSYMNEVIIEEFLENATEYTVSILGNSDCTYSSVIKLVYSGAFHVYDEKNKQSRLQDRELTYELELDEAIRNELVYQAKKLFLHYRMKDFARFDFLYDGRAYLMEINALPVLGNSFSWEWQKKSLVSRNELLGLLLAVFHFRKLESGKPDSLPKQLIDYYPSDMMDILRGPVMIHDNPPESTIPSGQCEKVNLYSMVDRVSAETEVLIFLKAMVILLKPSKIVETGTFKGSTTFSMAEGVVMNQHGHLTSIEIDPELAEAAQEKIGGYPVDIVNINSLQYIPDEKIDLLFLDSCRKHRIAEFHHFRPYLRSNSIIIWHDSSPEHEDVHRAVEELYKNNVIDRILLPTPRGITICKLK